MLSCWMVREITFANDFDGLPLGLAARTEPMRRVWYEADGVARFS